MTRSAGAVRPWALLAERNFGALWIAQVVSGFGDRITIIALADLTWRLTHSSLYTALAVIVATVPHAVFGFFAGPIADTLGPRRAMVLCDVVRAVTVGAIPVAVALALPLAVVYVLVLVATLCTAVFNPARLSLVPELVPSGQLGTANSLVLVSDRTVEIVGFAAAGVLVAVVGSAAFYVDAATFVFSALALQRIALTGEGTGEPLSVRSVLRESGTGLRVIRSNAVLYLNMLFSLAAQMSIAVVNTLTPVFLFSDLRTGPEAFGASEAALGLGAACFGLLVPLLMARVRKGRLVVSGFAVYALLLVALSQTPGVEIAIALFALMGMANVLFLIPNMTISQEHTPAAVRTRVFSTRIALLNLTWLPVMLAGGALGDVVGAAALIGVAGVFMLAVAVAGALVPAVRDVP